MLSVCASSSKFELGKDHCWRYGSFTTRPEGFTLRWLGLIIMSDVGFR